MMQQIATKTSDVATSTLPFDVKVEPANGTDFALVLQQSRDTTSAFENAKVRAEKMQGDAPNRTESKHDEASGYKQANDKGSQAANTPLDKQSSKASNSAEAGKHDAEPATDENNNKASAGISNAEDSSANRSNANDSSDDSVESDFAVTQENREKLDQILAEDNAEFDYINYVSLIKELSAEDADSQHSLTEDEEKFAALQLALNESIAQTEADSKSTDIQDVPLDSIDDALADFALVHINQEELQAILLAQQGNREQASLSSEELKRLEEAVNKLLSQLADQKNVSTSTETEKKLDASLMTELLQQPVDASDEVLDALAQAVSAGQTTEQNHKLDAVNNEQQNIKQMKDASAQIAEIASDELLTPKAQAQGDGSELSVKDIAFAGAAEHHSLQQNGEQLKNNADVQIKVNPSTNQNQNTIEKLAGLDEERINKALENLKQRLESIVPEIKQDAKGNEFIAALQSGIKEFKEQIKQGREPGLDLKSLVAEAMQKSDIDFTPAAQVKLEPNLNQFSAMLNLASSVQAQNLHAQGLLTPSESITLEKVGQSFAQSMESASGSTKLSAQQASALDKAVNIFKPDGQQQLVEKVRWMINGRNTAAEIRLDPPELGAMQIKVNLSGDAAAVSFTVQSIQAKEALDQAVPRLRDMLQEQGIELGQSSVQQDSRGQSDGQQENASSQGSGGSSVSDTSADESVTDSHVIEQRVAGNTLGGIDYYA